MSYVAVVSVLISLLIQLMTVQPAAGQGGAQPASPPVSQMVTLTDVVGKAIGGNPEVQLRWHNFLAAGDERGIVKGGYLPRVDVTAGVGRERYWQERLNPTTSYFNRADATIFLTQMLYDGFATRNELRYMDHARLTRYYELLDAVENTALEAARAYLDVSRYRIQTELAQENYDIHKEVFAKVQQQVRAGVGRGVDLEQAGGRLALALANRTTEYANLHDVSARYLRIIGEPPASSLAEPVVITQGIPADAYSAQVAGALGNPAIRAAMANLQAMNARKESREANYHPKLDLRAHHSTGYERLATRGKSNETVVELVLSFNLYKGGSDQAAMRQAQQLASRAIYERNLTCDNMRQTLNIAYNDISSLAEKLTYLDGHQDSMARARGAYRDQFDIGQRTLLDLLDAENEYFEARRAYVNADYDYMLAHVRTLAVIGQLLQSLHLQRADLPDVADLRYGSDQEDPLTFCPPLGVVDTLVLPPTYAEEMAADSDGDGVMDAYDLCPDTPVGIEVDALGCPVAISLAVPGIPVEVVRSTININFAFDSSTIPEADVMEVTRIGDFMKHYENTRVIIEGHTDNVGSHAYNQRLSQARADAVRDRLILLHGIDPERISAIGYSFDRPIAPNDTAEGRALNRRVDAVSSDGEQPLEIPEPEAVPSSSVPLTSVEEQNITMIRLLEGVYPPEVGNTRLKHLLTELPSAFLLPVEQGVALYAGSFRDPVRAENLRQELLKKNVVVTAVEVQLGKPL